MRFLFFAHIILLLLSTSFGICQNSITNKNKAIYLVTDANAEPLAFATKEQLIAYLKEITSKEKQKGFLTAHFEKLEKLNDSTYITSLTKKESITFLEIRNFDAIPDVVKKEFLTLKVDRTQIPIQDIPATIKNINNKLSKSGYPFNALKFKNFKEDQNKLIAELEVSGLDKRQMDSIAVKGYKKFPVGFLKHYAGFKLNTIYNNENTLNQTQLINALSFASSAKPAEVLFNPKKTILYLYLKKENANNFDGFIGFSTEEETGSFVLNGYANLNLVNNFNLGEELRIAFKNDSETQQQFSLHTKIPYIFKKPLGIEASLNIFTQDEAFSTTEQNIGLNYTFTPRIEALAAYKKYESADLNEDENIASVNNNFESQFLNMELRYIQRQNKLLFPQKTAIILSSEIGERSSENINQLKLGANIKHIFQLNNRNSIFIGNNFQYFISDNLLSNELYRLGGILSIRGFEENSLRASLFNVLNTEYRYQLSNTIYAHSIIDVGFIENDFTNTTDQLTSFGVGIAILSKAGLFKLNYANGRSDNIPFEFGNSKVHLSLTAYF